MNLDTPTLADRLTTARLERDTLERDTGAAVLDGKPVDPLAVSAARATVDALEAAETETVRRDRAAKDSQKAVERAEARKALAESLGDYTAAVERAEAAATAMVDAFKDVEQHAGRMRGHYRVLGRVPPGLLDPYEMRDAHSRMLGTKLKPLTGQMCFGVLEWSGFEVADWTEYARNSVGRAVEPAIEGN